MIADTLKLPQSTLLAGMTLIVTLLAPPFLFLHEFRPHVLNNVDDFRLVLLCLSISFPLFLINILLMAVYRSNDKRLRRIFGIPLYTYSDNKKKNDKLEAEAYVITACIFITFILILPCVKKYYTDDKTFHRAVDRSILYQGGILLASVVGNLTSFFMYRHSYRKKNKMP